VNWFDALGQMELSAFGSGYDVSERKVCGLRYLKIKRPSSSQGGWSAEYSEPRSISSSDPKRCLSNTGHSRKLSTVRKFTRWEFARILA
jgi:hypothetical protein